MQRELYVRLPYTTPPLSLNDRMHWRAKAKIVRDVRDYVSTTLQAMEPGRADYVWIRLHYVPRDGRRRDSDNLVATLKACKDGVVDAGIVPDDTPDWITWHPPIIDQPEPHNPHLYLIITLGEPR